MAWDGRGFLVLGVRVVFLGTVELLRVVFFRGFVFLGSSGAGSGVGSGVGVVSLAPLEGSVGWSGMGGLAGLALENIQFLQAAVKCAAAYAEECGCLAAVSTGVLESTED